MIRSHLRAAMLAAVVALLALPAWAAAAGEDFDPSLEFAVEPYWFELTLGPFDLSINKAVIYLLLTTVILCVGGIWVVRGGLRMRPTKAQNLVEMAYEFADSQIGRATLPARAMPTWFPYLATLFLFIAVNNIISFIPLPMSHEADTFPGGLPDLGLYAATANINVTLTLAALTFLATHVVGVRAHGPGGYLKTLVPDAPGAVKPFIVTIEVLSQILRLVSLSVRLFANLLAGHLLIIMAAGFVILVGSVVGAVAIPFAVFFWVFEWVLVAGLQAFIFALLSGVYIGYAMDAPH
ncbi:MAG TPA: F0F1 ATP synthase subunit A [Miltoncostaeaceae bacterium]|nr:F0F1 ATP synthase subunit A [Miltoncostaeaceae bacterium]